MLKIPNIKMPLDYLASDLKKKVAEFLRVDENKIEKLILDRRETVKGEGEVYFKMTFLVALSPELEKKLLVIFRKKGVTEKNITPFTVKKKASNSRPVVVGFGPAGIFSALVLSMSGLSPIVLERGEKTEDRIKTVEHFKKTGELNPESNIQFGEGGAGAFSDGKLKVGYKDRVKRMILSELVKAGADESILYLEKPHVGSDVLHRVIVNLRHKIESLGGEIIFGARFESLITKDGSVMGLIYTKNNEEHTLSTESVILATGHSARDTLENLYSQGVQMEQKGFGIGVRIEHPQELINTLEYGVFKDSPKLSSADYKMVTHLKNSRSLYTFCMCPGGYVVPASSELGGICTNGMSEFARDGKNANTALLVSVFPSDFPSSHPLAGVELQRSIERCAFELAGGDYKAPVIRLEDFMKGCESHSFGDVLPTYSRGTVFMSPDAFFPKFISETLRMGIIEMGKYKKGWLYSDALITAPETRTTSPVKLIRQDLEAKGISGLFPAGEGAGYGGGIISSAVDGVICAEKILDKM